MQHEHPNPATREPVEAVSGAEHPGQRFLRPLPEEDDLTFWKTAMLETKGRILAELLELVDAIGNYPPKKAQFCAFPRPGEYRRHE